MEGELWGVLAPLHPPIFFGTLKMGHGAVARRTGSGQPLSPASQRDAPGLAGPRGLCSLAAVLGQAVLSSSVENRAGATGSGPWSLSARQALGGQDHAYGLLCTPRRGPSCSARVPFCPGAGTLVASGKGNSGTGSRRKWWGRPGRRLAGNSKARERAVREGGGAGTQPG